MKKDHQIFSFIEKEYIRQKKGIELIASENFVSEQVLSAAGTVLTNKYAEGLPYRRYYGGCEVVDEVEQLAINRLKELFGVEWANVQPHSGAQANLAVLFSILKPGDKIMGFNLSHGGHLTHGSPITISGKYFQAFHYGVEEDTKLIDWDKVSTQIEEIKPKLVICGASAYSRDWDYKKLRVACDTVGAFLLADIAHPAALIAKGHLNNPIPYCDFITSTTHKTLRGPRGGIIMMGKDYPNPMGIKSPKGKTRMMSSLVDSAVFPGIQGGPLEHIIAAKAISFFEALQEDFQIYTQQVIQNAKSLAKAFIERGYEVLTGGTDNHSILIDLSNKDFSGKYAENTLIKADITINKNMVPFDKRSPFITSGIRLGTAAVTTRGLKQEDMEKIAGYMDEVLCDKEGKRIQNIKQEINIWMEEYPLFSY